MRDYYAKEILEINTKAVSAVLRDNPVSQDASPRTSSRTSSTNSEEIIQ